MSTNAKSQAAVASSLPLSLSRDWCSGFAVAVALPYCIKRGKVSKYKVRAWILVSGDVSFGLLWLAEILRRARRERQGLFISQLFA